MTDEPRDTRLRRLRMRSMRRGIKEMDLILSNYAAHQMNDLDPQALDTYEALLAENDQDIYAWITRQTPPPPRFAKLIDRLRADAEGLTRPAAD